jgi:hypothetical protein
VFIQHLVYVMLLCQLAASRIGMEAMNAWHIPVAVQGYSKLLPGF